MRDLIDVRRARGQLRLGPLSDDRAADLEAAGLRHRTKGLAARLAHKAAENPWTPPNRVEASSAVLRSREGRRALVHERIATRSHTAFQEAVNANDLEVMRSALRDDIAAYRRLSTSPTQTARRVVSRLVSLWRRCHCA